MAFGKADGHIDGVNLYCQRAGDAAPVKMGTFTHSPAIDTRPLKVAGVPEERTYTVVGVVADQEIRPGQPGGDAGGEVREGRRQSEMELPKEKARV